MVLKHEWKTLGYAVGFLLVMLVSPAITKDFGILTRMLYAALLVEQGVALCTVADPAFANEISGPMGYMRGYAQHIKAEVTPVFRPQRAPERRNDPRGHAGVEAKRIADRDGDLARLQGFRIAELCRGKLRVLIGPDQGEIGVGVVAEDAAGEAAPIKRHHLGMLGALHDMTIGQNKAVRRDDYAGAGPGSRAVAVADIETHDAWPDPLDDLGHGLRIGVQKRIVRVCIVWQRIVPWPVCGG